MQDYGENSEEIKAYLHGDVVPSERKGWCLVRSGGYSIGWGKGDGRVLKNHYPKGLRGFSIQLTVKGNNAAKG